MKKKLLFFTIILSLTGFYFFNKKPSLKQEAFVAIANYGPHSSLEETIVGIKKQLAERGYVENKNLRYEILNVGFDTSLIPQMITNLAAQKPDVLVVIATPVAQFAKNKIKNIPIVYADITDPVAAGLIKNPSKPEQNVTGASEEQNLDLMLRFAKEMMPQAKNIGVLYSSSEANDDSLLKALKISAKNNDMQVFALAIDNARDIKMRIGELNGKVDFIYVGTSGAIQPALPSIVAEANKMGIPIINADSDAVLKKQVLASFGVNYLQIGVNAGNLVADILKSGIMPAPIVPGAQDHRAYVNKSLAIKYGFTIPASSQIVE